MLNFRIFAGRGAGRALFVSIVLTVALHTQAAAQTDCGSIGPPAQACTVTVTMQSGSHKPVASPDYAKVPQGVTINWKPDTTCGYLFVALPKAPQIFSEVSNHWFTTVADAPVGAATAHTTPEATKYNLYCSVGTEKGFADPKVIIVSGGGIGGHRRTTKQKP